MVAISYWRVTPDNFPTICSERHVPPRQKMRGFHCRPQHTYQDISPDWIDASPNKMFRNGATSAKNVPRFWQEPEIPFIAIYCVLTILIQLRRNKLTLPAILVFVVFPHHVPFPRNNLPRYRLGILRAHAINASAYQIWSSKRDRFARPSRTRIAVRFTAQVIGMDIVARPPC